MTDVELQKSITTLIQDNFSVKIERDSKNQDITSLFKEGFKVATPSGPRQVNSKMLQQLMWRIMNKTKPLDFELQSNRPENIEYLATCGLETMARKSELIANLRCKQGVKWNSYLYGDGYYMWGTQTNPNIPVIFSVIPNSNIYTDQYCTYIRGTKGRSCTKLLAIFSMSPAQAYQLFPMLKREQITGQIPRDIQQLANVELGRSYQQTYQIQDMIEVGYYFDIDNPDKPRFSIVAGTQMKVVEKYENTKYPFRKDDEPYIPVGQEVCMPSAEGFSNHGIGELFYDLAIVSRRLFNLGYGHAEQAIYPTAFVSVEQGESAKFFASVAEANKGRAMGKNPIVPLEYDPTNPNASRVAVQTIVTQGSIQELQIMLDLITKEINRCGINLDDLDINPQATQYQILAEEEKSTAWIQQVQEYNADSYQFSLEILLDLCKKFIKNSNKTPINVPVMIEGDMEIRRGDFTLGAWRDEINKHHYYLKVDSRSGAIPSNVAKQTRLQRSLALTQPGSEDFIKISKQIGQLNGVNLGTKSIAQPEGGGGMPPGLDEPAMPDTEQPMPGKRMSPEELAAATA